MEEIKVAIPPVIFKEDNPIIYHQETKPVKWCYRRKVGTYPKFLLSPAKKVLRFCFRFTHYRIEIIPRGRGKRSIFALQDNVYAPRYWQDLPIRHAKKVAVYISIIRRRRYA